MKYSIITDSDDPITLDEVKEYLSVECTDFDDLLESYITAAREYVESKTNYKLGEAVIDCIYPKFESEMWVEKAPVASITHIKYYDGENVLQTLATDSYESSLIGFPATVKAVHGMSFPVSYTRYDAVTIRIVTGEDYPKPLITAMKMIIGHWYENRQDVVTGHSTNEIPLTSQHLCELYKLPILR